jgi:hypothetical protein
MLIDLSQLGGCTIDAASATASVQPASRGSDLAPALAEHGLAFPVGHCGSVALSGYDALFETFGALWPEHHRSAADTLWSMEDLSALLSVLADDVAQAPSDNAEPLGVGHYIAETDLLAAPTRAERSFAPETWERLREVRARGDPEGVFQPFLHP